jgi:hypothetical protein
VSPRRGVPRTSRRGASPRIALRGLDPHNRSRVLLFPSG